MKKITLAVALVGLALAGGIAATDSAKAQVAPVALEQTLGHGDERGECDRGDHDNDGDRC